MSILISIIDNLLNNRRKAKMTDGKESKKAFLIITESHILNFSYFINRSVEIDKGNFSIAASNPFKKIDYIISSLYFDK
jgi:hypothetical protein